MLGNNGWVESIIARNLDGGELETGKWEVLISRDHA